MIHDNYHIPTKTISHNDKPVMEVRGLSFADISSLCNEHRDDLNMVIEMWQIFAQNTTPVSHNNMVDRFTEYAIQLLSSAPSLVAKVIAMCADAMDKIDVVISMPLSIQISAIEAIASLTASDFGGAKEMLGKIMRLIGANVPKELKDQMKSLETVSDLSGMK